MFIVIEGADGTGKSTLAAKLANHLGATLTFEPSHGPIGWWVRQNLSDLSAATLPYLFAADRAQHVTETIAPALAAGEMVVCDRYIPSSVAYQGLDAIQLNTTFPVPDLTILLTVSPDVARQRIAARDALTPFEERHAADLGARYVSALNALGWRYLTIDLEEIATLVEDRQEYFDEVRAALAGIGQDTSAKARKRLVKLAQLRRLKRFPPARLVVDELDGKDDDHWNHCRVIGAGQDNAGIGRRVPWE